MAPMIPFVYELLLVAVAPSVFLLWFFRHKERYARERLGIMTKVLLMGALWIIPAVIIEYVGSLFIVPDSGLLETIVFFYAIVGPVEEYGKYYAVKSRAFKSPKFRGPMDGIVLGVAAALGFATIENIAYVFSAGTPGDQLLTGIVRAFLSVPGHAFWGAISGFYLGQARYESRPELRYTGLGVASFLHGTFDSTSALVMAFAGDSAAFALVGLVVLFGIVYLSYAGIVKREIGTAEHEPPMLPAPVNRFCSGSL